ncbi:hypothetical protein OPIT5_29400 [Opitutaceae bacterium TAV5]|nr:hypothetical protein OPIT5_21720 [Opitutaceae bacterium TAV5]AHF94895.1 hypothetical protein OPIT5_29400 [Opitutaceae bacterium TAV5]
MAPSDNDPATPGRHIHVVMSSVSLAHLLHGVSPANEVETAIASLAVTLSRRLRESGSDKGHFEIALGPVCLSLTLSARPNPDFTEGDSW